MVATRPVPHCKVQPDSVPSMFVYVQQLYCIPGSRSLHITLFQQLYFYSRLAQSHSTGF